MAGTKPGHDGDVAFSRPTLGSLGLTYHIWVADFGCTDLKIYQNEARDPETRTRRPRYFTPGNRLAISFSRVASLMSVSVILCPTSWVQNENEMML